MEIKPRKALNKAFLKLKPSRTEIEKFKSNLIRLIDSTNETESEEHHKNLLIDFLKKTYYDSNHFINTKGYTDLVIHNGKEASTSVGVLIETKKPTNKTEMLSSGMLNVKAFHELVLYYMKERIVSKNLEIKHLIVSNINEWFVFDARIFESTFANNNNFVKQFEDFVAGRLVGKTTEFFYKEIARPFIKKIQKEIEYTHFDIREYDTPLRNADKKDDKKLIALYKLLSPEHLLKLPFANDSNSLDKRFYSELLHVIGLKETKDKGKKIITRNKEEERNSGSLIENAIIQLDSLNKINRLDNRSQYGDTSQDRLFNVGLELSITWVNRVLFLKLLEAQLISYHKGDESYAFLNFNNIKNYDDLNSLFFQVLAKTSSERNDEVKQDFFRVPYLNSSLFEPNELEHSTILISNLRDEKTLPILTKTVLKDDGGKKRKGELNALQYFFEFLESYDFSSEGGEDIQEDNKTLINASVLGLIFEKINGYKDGSFFTPGFITMYMCRDTIRKSVVNKFNETKGWLCKDIGGLYDKIENRQEANDIINNLKVCDPAVGSGHFLVSALNELISIKNDLKILQDRSGKRLKEYHFEVVNDELIITDDDGELFEYHSTNRESQRVQEALFHEKQTIIENCLFGVDINPNSVKICRLRLWIELLKNTYYINDHELETLPNIDINIKCGNSLINRFDLDTGIKKALKKSKWTIDSYRLAIDSYRNAKNKEEKYEMERLITSIKNDFRSEVGQNTKEQKQLIKLKAEFHQKYITPQLFEDTLTLKQRKEKDKGRKTLEGKIKSSTTKIEEIKNNKIYENAFEWRFEFPEVLDDEGKFIGFDAIIGNPPYVFGGNLGISEAEKKYFKANFKTGSGKINLYTLFMERSFQILNSNSEFTFIVPNTFLRVTSYDSSRKFMLNNFKINSIYDFGDQVFEDAVTTAIVIMATKEQKDEYSIKANNKGKTSILKKSDVAKNNFVITLNFNQENQNIVHKMRVNKLLGFYCKEMIFGVVISNNKSEIVSSNPKQNWKPFLEGREISPYQIDEVKQWLNYDPKLLHRARTEVPEKILIQRITGGKKPLKAAYDNKQHYNKESINNIILNQGSEVSTKYILALLNSKLINWFYSNQYTNESNLTVNLSKAYLSQIPIALPDKLKVIEIESLVDKILKIKKNNATTDTSILQDEIDQIVYKLYDLTEKESTIIEKSMK